MIARMIMALVVLSSFIFGFFFASQANAGFDCLSLNTSSTQSEKDYCRTELAQIEAQLAVLLNQQKEQQKQTGSLKGDVDYLTSQINALKAKIKARALVIAQLKVNITEKINQITSLSLKIDREHESLAQLLRNTNEFDNQTMVHLILSDDSVSNFYSDLESYDSIKKAVKESVDVIRGIKMENEVAKKDLEKKQDAETDAKAELESAQKTIAKSEANKKELLAISKNKEAEYATLAAQKKIQADKIRSALFPLGGISQKIEFGTALQYANEAKVKFNIDPAFLLAIFTKESNLGANVGLCYLTDTNTGSGQGVNTGSLQIRVMHPTRDIPPFLDIVNKLNLNFNTTRVSCWQPVYSKDGSAFGWGGAMGPAQFIPSTWKGFETRLKNLLGYDANPWNPRDAFMASAMYLTDLGAVGNSASAQHKAACQYFGTRGNSCSYSTNKKHTGVMDLKNIIQANIDLL